MLPCDHGLDFNLPVLAQGSLLCHSVLYSNYKYIQ